MNYSYKRVHNMYSNANFSKNFFKSKYFSGFFNSKANQSRLLINFSNYLNFSVFNNLSTSIALANNNLFCFDGISTDIKDENEIKTLEFVKIRGIIIILKIGIMLLNYFLSSSSGINI